VQGLAQFVASIVSSHQHMALTDTVLPLRIPMDEAAKRRHRQIHKKSDHRIIEQSGLEGTFKVI